MQKQFLPIWLIVSFCTFMGSGMGQSFAPDFAVNQANLSADSTGVAVAYDSLACTVMPWPATSDDVVQWLMSPMPCEESLDIVEACVRQKMQEGEGAGAAYSWRRALAHAMMGVLAFRREQFAEALENFEVFRRLAVEQFGPASRAVSSAEICLGRASFVQGNDAQAVFYYKSATSDVSVVTLLTRPYLVQVCRDLLECYERQSYWAGVSLYAEMLAQYEERRPGTDTLQWVQMLIRASMAHVQLASDEGAYVLLRHAQALMRVHREALMCYQVEALLIQARLKANEEKYGEAMHALLRAQKWCTENSEVSPASVGNVQLTAAEVALQQQILDLAERYLKQYEQEQKRPVSEDLPLLTKAIWIKGQIWREKGRHYEAIKLLEGHLAVLQRANFSVPEEANLRMLLAQLYVDKNLLNEAENHLQQAIRHYQMTFSETHPNTLKAYLILSEVYVRKGALLKASQYADLTIAILQGPAHQTSYSARLLLLEALLQRSRCLFLWFQSYEAEEKLAKAYQTFKEGYQLVHQLRQSARSLEQVLALSSRLERLTEMGVAIAYQQYTCENDGRYLEEAFNAVQLSQDLVWIPLFAETKSQTFAPLVHHLPGDSKRLYAACLEQAVRYWRILSETAPDRPEAALRQAEVLKRANEAYYTFLDTLNWKHRLLLSVYTPVDANQITAKLLKKEAFLHYFVGQEAIYVFVLMSKVPLDVVKIPLDFPLSEWAGAMRSAIVSRTERMHGFYKPAHDLYLRVFKPVEERLAGRAESIAIVPHGALSSVPFGALLVNSPRIKKAHRPCDYNYLIRHYAVYYAYSANHWLSSRKSKVRWPERRAYVVAPRDRLLKQGIEEAKNVGRLIGCMPLSDTLEKAQLLDTLREGQLIHIVGHSQAANDAVIYWKGAVQDSAEHLYASDVLALSLKVRLVGLSACETALPSYYHPYGLSMARAFAYAGAACVTGADWAIEDNASQKIMEDFYSRLRKRRTDSKAHALQEAQRDFLEQCNSRTSHPYYWAGFRLYGDARPFERPERRAIRQMARAVRKGLKHISP